MELIGKERQYLGLLMFVSGIFIAFAFTALGGLLSPDLSPAPDYASDQLANYFFQSFLLLLALHFIWPVILDMTKDSSSSSWLHAFLMQDQAFFLALSCALAAMNCTLWGIYHEMRFSFTCSNSILCLAYAGFRLRMGSKKGETSLAKQQDLPSGYRRE